MSAPTLSDGSVRLRAIDESDVDAYMGAFAEGDDFLSLLGYDDVPERGRIERYFDHNWLEPPELHAWEFAVADATTDEFLGTMMIHSCDWKNRRAEIGAWMIESKREEGVGQAALHLLLAWAFNDLGMERMEMTALPENASVPHIAKKFGFTYEGTLRQRNLERGRRVDLLIWGLLRDEWEPLGE